jgi:hypothetical protein
MSMTQLRYLKSDVSRATADEMVKYGAGGPQPLLAFSVRHSGTVGQEVLGPDGRIVAWTTDGWAAQVICKLLNENEELLRRKAG